MLLVSITRSSGVLQRFHRHKVSTIVSIGYNVLHMGYGRGKTARLYVVCVDPRTKRVLPAWHLLANRIGRFEKEGDSDEEVIACVNLRPCVRRPCGSGIR